MAVNDLQTFLQEKLRSFDENMDISSGSPVDVQVIQPILRRLGTDPFTVDLAVFIQERLSQAFPELATQEGDAVTDLLVKPATLLWDAIVREIFRIRSAQSFKDPSSLTTEEAEALGANLFSDRAKGEYSRGVGRLYYPQPRTISVTPANFFTSKSGAHYFPDGRQDITSEEMLLNVDGSLYYFDVNLIAEAPGSAYNIGPNELITVANLEGAVKVANLRRFRDGVDEETSADFIDRTQQSLTERSMVTQRGIGSVVTDAFPEVTRIAVVGHGDPEMKRDVIRGGGLGDLVYFGTQGQPVLDGEGRPRTRRFSVSDMGIDFSPMSSSPSSYVVTIFSAFAEPPFVRDLPVRSVLSATLLELEDQVLVPAGASKPWSIRKRELSLSGIPGGLLFPNTSSGTVVVENDAIHVGGCTDISVGGSEFDEATLIVDSLYDDAPAASGSQLSITGTGEVTLYDYVLGTSYAVGDVYHTAFADAKLYGFTLQVLSGPHAGDYRVLDVQQVSGGSPVLTLDSALPTMAGSFRWRLVDTIEVDLLEPKSTKVPLTTGLATVQGSPLAYSSAGVDFLALGVSAGDVLRVVGGGNAGDYTVSSLPAYNAVQVDRNFTYTAGDGSYYIFSPNAGGGVSLPLVRVTKVELLDASGQPTGSVIPYAKPVDIQGRNFENPGRGVKVDVTDAVLGIVTEPEPPGGFALSGTSLIVQFVSGVTGYPTVNVNFAGTRSAAQVVSDVNSAAASALGMPVVLAVLVGSRVGIVPLDPYTRISSSSSSLVTLFGDTQTRTCLDIRSSSVPSWEAVAPAINQDGLDVLQVLDGTQVGFYGNLKLGSELFADSSALVSIDTVDYTELRPFAPEVGVHVQVGSRSLGSARCYFLSPTSVEFDKRSRFYATLEDGSSVGFLPDPTTYYVKIPAAPSTVLPKDAVTSGGSGTFTSATSDFILSSVVPGDQLVLKYIPLLGATLPNPVQVANLSLVVSINGGADQTIYFGTDVSGMPTYVSRSGVASQINTAVGRVIASISSTNQLELEGDVSILVRPTGTANTLLGFSTSVYSDNRSPHAGTYDILAVTNQTQLVLSPVPSGVTTVSRQAFELRRPGMQRVSSTAMASNVAEAGLYYADVELVSEGTGDIFNVSSLQLTATGIRSDGYYLSNDDANLTFSMLERPSMHISRSMLEVGVSDDPANATQLTGQRIEITYDRSSLVSDVQTFAQSDSERVVCSSTLARHLVPHFVRLDYAYVGGSTSDILLTDITNYVKGLYPSDSLESSDLVNLGYLRGATSVSSPLDLIALVHNYDRTIYAQRSQNSLNVGGSLAAFIPDVVNVNRRAS